MFWYIIDHSNFFEIENRLEQKLRYVRFVCPNHHGYIRGVEVTFSIPNEVLYIRINFISVTQQFSATTTTAIKKWCDIYNNQKDYIHFAYKKNPVPDSIEFDDEIYEKTFAFPRCEFAAKHPSFNRMFKIFEVLNQEYKNEAFNKDILNELQRILHFLEMERNGTPVKFVHSIPSLRMSGKHVDRTPLFNAIRSGKRVNNRTTYDDAGYRSIKRILSSGEDVNQCNTLMHPLYLAVFIRAEARVIALLLRYHADALCFDNVEAVTPIVLALRIGLLDILETFLNAFSAITRPVSSPIQSIELTKLNKTIQTEIKFKSNLVLTTQLKDQPNPAEKAGILNLCRATFFLPDDPDKKQLTQSVEQDIHSPNALIELIYHDKVLVGFIIFNIITDGDDISLYCSLASMALAFRALRIIGMLSWRNAFALQILRPESRVSVSLILAHHSSFRLLEGQLCWPVYQPPHLEQVIRQLLERIAPGTRLHYSPENSVCYIENQLAVHIDERERNANDNAFYTDELGQQEFKLDHRAAFGFFYVSDHSLQHLLMQMLVSGINGTIHLQVLAPMLKQLLLECGIELPAAEQSAQTYYWKQAHALFWKNDSLPGTIAIPKIPIHKL